MARLARTEETLMQEERIVPDARNPEGCRPSACDDPLAGMMREVRAFFEASGCPCAAANPEVLRAVVEERLLRAQRREVEHALARPRGGARRAA
jgi:hypothetical protein